MGINEHGTTFVKLLTCCKRIIDISEKMSSAEELREKFAGGQDWSREAFEELAASLEIFEQERGNFEQERGNWEQREGTSNRREGKRRTWQGPRSTV